MKKNFLYLTLLFIFLTSFVVSGNLGEVFFKYKKLRKATIKRLSKELDPVFMDKFAKFNRAKRALIKKIIKENPEIKKIKDPKERRKALRSKAQKFRKENDPLFLKYLKLRMDLDFYLFSKNPRLKKLYLKIKDSKFYKRWMY